MTSIESINETAQQHAGLHPELARGFGEAREGLSAALHALRNHAGGSVSWSNTQSAAIRATRSAIGAVDAVLSQFEDLPEPLLDALVGAGNESRRLLENVQAEQGAAQPTTTALLCDRYQRVLAALEELGR